MAVLVTGAQGTLGRELVPRLLSQGQRVYALSRHPEAPENPDLIPLRGDILKWDLGLKDVPPDIEAIYHMAALVDLGRDPKGRVWKTNVEGSHHVFSFAREHRIPHVYYVSTAYASGGRNAYELSKARSEEDLEAFRCIHGLKATVFKPSILVGNSSTHRPAVGAFYQFVLMIARAHRRAELVRRRLEGALRLPVLEPVFRIKGDPSGKLNLVPVDAVADFMASTEAQGTFFVTNPEPPSLGELADWVGEFVLLKIRFQEKFESTPIEALFERAVSAFCPYLGGDRLPSDLKGCPPVDRHFVHTTLGTLFR